MEPETEAADRTDDDADCRDPTVNVPRMAAHG